MIRISAKKTGGLDRRWVFAGIIIAALLIDQLTKYFVRLYKPSFWAIKDFLSITYTQNTGAAFGILNGMNLLLAAAAFVVLVAVIYYFRKIPPKFVPYAALLFAGALGNLIDRIAIGHVIDFISFSFWPAFNVADICVTAGVLGLVIFIWKD